MVVTTNVSISANLHEFAIFLDLKKITNSLSNCIYQNKYFVRAIVKLRHPSATVMIYDTGKLVCLGAKSESDGRKALRRIARMIQKLGYNVKLHNVFVTNIAATHQLKEDFEINDFYYFLINSFTPFDYYSDVLIINGIVYITK